MEVLVVLFCVSVVGAVQYYPELYPSYNSTCNATMSCGLNMVCNKKLQTCQCADGYEYDILKEKCTQCHGLHEQCTNCCYPPDKYYCAGKLNKFCVCISNCNDSFIMAAQVALGSALAIAFFALVALFWKTCPRRNRQGGRTPPVMRERESSLSSIQRFVIQRLRDRPPRYEDNNQIRLEKPPPYQETTNADAEVPESWDISPPLYSEAVGRQTRNVSESDKPEEATHSLRPSRSRTPRTSEARQQGESSSSSQLQSGVDNRGFTGEEVTNTRHSETELHM